MSSKTMTGAERKAKVRAKDKKERLQQQKWNAKHRARKAARSKVTYKPKVQKKLAADAYKRALSAEKEAKKAGAKAEAADSKASQSLDVADQALQNTQTVSRFTITLDARPGIGEEDGES